MNTQRTALHWTKNAKGNFTTSYRGAVCTVFFRNSLKPEEMGWVWVHDGEFSNAFEKTEDAMKAAERFLTQ